MLTTLEYSKPIRKEEDRHIAGVVKVIELKGVRSHLDTLATQILI
jgi:hypothetical protein